MAAGNKHRHSIKKGFTLVEIMVVVTIIGLLASIAIPSYQQSRNSAIASKTASDFKRFADQFNLYALQKGTWPDDGYPGTIPAGMESYLADNVWQEVTPLGGNWDYDNSAFGFTSGVSIDSTTLGDDALLAVDSLLDDGSLSTGIMIKTGGNRLSYILER